MNFDIIFIYSSALFSNCMVQNGSFNVKKILWFKKIYDFCFVNSERKVLYGSFHHQQLLKKRFQKE